jgi:hypothetical protein
MPVQTQLQQRRGTAATWTSTNPTLAAGEIGFESDTGKFKIGTGSTAWASLAYATNGAVVSPLTTKGDLFTYSTTNARLAVGNNGESLVADSSTSTGLRYQSNFAAGKNKIINGDMGVWQRGTSITAPNGVVTYGPDRFYMFSVHSSGTASMSQQTFTLGTAPVAGYEGQFFTRLTAGAAGSPSAYMEFVQRIEDVRTFAGQTVTLSFWAKASTNVTTTPIIAQNFGVGGSSQVNTFSGTTAITTSWQRFTVTFTVPSISGKTIGSSSSLQVVVLVGNVTNSQTIDIWGVQIEAGSVATAFQTATGTIQGELAACQRYYYRQTATSAYSYFSGMWTAATTSVIDFGIQFPVTMRTTPSSFEYSTLLISNQVSIYAASGTFTGKSESTPQWGVIRYTHGSGVFTQYLPYLLQANNSTSAYLGFSAEL